MKSVYSDRLNQPSDFHTESEGQKGIILRLSQPEGVAAVDGLKELVVDNPLVAFTTLLLVSLTLPPLFERLRLPGLVGLLFAGVVLGPSVLGLLDPAGDIEKLFADVGKVYLMFVAALEVDLKEFSRNRDRAIGVLKIGG